MDAMDRRNVLRGILFGAVAAGFGTSVLSTVAKAAPITLEKDLAAKVGSTIEKTQMVVTSSPRPVYRRPRRSWRGRRRVCWWRHGRRVCAWR